MNLNAARSWAVQELADALQSVLQAMTAIRPRISWQPWDDTAPGDTQPEESIWWAQAFTGLPSPSVGLGGTVTAVNALGQSVLSALGTEDASPEDARSACQDLFAQTANALAKSMSELSFTPGASNGVTAANAPQGKLGVPLVLEIAAGPDAVLTVPCG